VKLTRDVLASSGCALLRCRCRLLATDRLCPAPVPAPCSLRSSPVPAPLARRGAALLRPAPLRCRRPARPALPQCRRRLLATRPPREEGGRKKTASVRIFGAIFPPRARVRSWILAVSAQDDGSVQREASHRVRLGARALAVVSRRDGSALSPHLL
jgi:hypothetical protein